MKTLNKKHKLFLIQLGLGILCFLALNYITKVSFYNSPKINSYLSINEGVKQMAYSSSALLDTLIIKNQVTFDPTSGKELEKVFNNLKYSKKEKLLMIGSSQLRTVLEDDITSSYNKIISKKIESKTNNRYQVYNLSLGAMTTSEKLIVAKKGMDILKPERILISVTPWDCLSNKIRKPVKELENQNVAMPQPRVNKADSLEAQEQIYFKFPRSINEKAESFCQDFINNSFSIYSKKTGIKKWFSDKYEQDIIGVEANLIKNIPRYWLTGNQELDNNTGWDNKVSKTGNKSLKIINKTGKNAKWQGDVIYIKNPTNVFEFEGWSKAENVSKETKLYCLDFQIIFEDGSTEWYFQNLKFSKGSHDWQKVISKVTFEKKVTAITPHFLLYGGKGTAWVDDVTIRPFYNEFMEENIVPNSSFEKEQKEITNMAYSPNNAEWGRIHNNIISIVDFLSLTMESKETKSILLMTPFWYTEKKSTYPQKEEYKKLINDVRNYCLDKDVVFVDASYILSKDNFSVYKNGSKKGRISVLHFDEGGHNKLANFIIKELNL